MVWSSGDSLNSNNLNTKFGMGPTWINVKDSSYGATGNGTTDDAPSFQSAIRAAEANGAGGVVFVPPGTFRLASGLTFAADTNNAVRLQGQSIRDSVLYPDASVHTAVTVGVTGSNAGYFSMRDLSINGGLVSAHTGCAIHMIRPQSCSIEDVEIEEFDGANGAGLYLEGSPTASAPHAWRNYFKRVKVATTRRPLVGVNFDENDFIGCDWGLPTGVTSRVTAIDIRQGHNNRFYGNLCSGDNSDFTNARPNYIGVGIASPTTGDNQDHQFYGLVCEGFDAGIWVASGTSQHQFYGYNGSINSSHYSASPSAASLIMIAPLHGMMLWPTGFANVPAFAFSDETTLGWYRSTTSILAVSQLGRLGVGSAAQFGTVSAPDFCWTADTNTGLLRSGEDIVDVVAGGVRAGRYLTTAGLGHLGFEGGSGSTPGLHFTADPSVGFWRSAVSTLAVSSGTFDLTQAKLSVKTYGSSSVTTSASVGPGELFVTIGVSGLSIGIESGGSLYFMTSTTSAG